MRIEETAIPDVKLIHLEPHADDRGLFVETYDTGAMAELGIGVRFVQDACSRNRRAGTIRALHFQIEPAAQAKLARANRGRALDVAVDLRHGSATFGQHVCTVLDASEWTMIYIPVGFAHGFCTLVDDTEMVYKISHHFSPEHARGLLWNDPDLGIEWPAAADPVTLSDKDRTNSLFKDSPVLFQLQD